MKLARLLTESIGIVLLVAVIGCSSATSVVVTATPHAEATIEAKVDAPTPTGLPSPPTAVGNTPAESRSTDLQGTSSDGLLSIDKINNFILCAMGRGSQCTMEPAIERGLFETGVKPTFPDNTDCRGIDEYWAMDYTAKRKGRESYHGGIDMPAPFGTPIYAAADGTVVGKFLGDHTPRGIEIVLRHSPQDTGLPVWTFSQYTHFSEMPSQEVGQRVRKAELLGPTGNTGIDVKTGKQHEHRRPAIHFGVFYNANGNYAVLKDLAIIPEDGYWMDPNAFFLVDHPFDTETLKALPDNDKRAPIPVLLADGNTIPRDTKTVWPYVCSEGHSRITDPKEKTAAPAEIAWDILLGDIEPVHGKGVPPSNGNGLGPWATRIMLASSEDGMNFERTAEIVVDQGGVPNMISDHDGRIRVYYVAWQQYGSDAGADGNFIAVAVRAAPGEWTYHRINVIGGSFKSSLVDPYVVKLEDGRYRLYFMADTGSFNLRIFSATSDDGVHFVLDEDERFGSGDPVYDPAVLKIGSDWRMWMGPDGLSSATSQDGLEFISTGPFIVEGRNFMTWSAISVPEGGYRLYGNFPGPGGSSEISSVFSEDGENWTIEPGTRLSAQGADSTLESQFAADNGLAISSDGTYLLAYLVAIP